MNRTLIAPIAGLLLSAPLHAAEKAKPDIAPVSADAPAQSSREIQALLEPIRARHGIPSLAAAIFNNQGIIATGATGSRKKGEKEPVTAQDLWHLGSETKAMTATLAGTFVREGKLAWTDKVADFFPEFAKRIHPDLRDTTIEALLSHRSGLTPNLPWSDYNNGNLIRSRRDAAKALLTTPPASKPGDYLYSNAGYVVVGAILEKLGGKPWEKLMEERLFIPLDMKSAGFGGTGTPGKLDQPWGHVESGEAVANNGPEVDNPAVMGPAGTVHASLADWSKFLGDQLKGASGDSSSLLPPSIYEAIQSPHPAGTGYGFGWGIARRPWAGGKVLTHNGSNTMNLAVCWLAIPKKFGIIVTTNQAGPKAEQATDEAVAALVAWQAKGGSAE